MSFSGGVSLQRELYYDLLLPSYPTQILSIIYKKRFCHCHEPNFATVNFPNAFSIWRLYLLLSLLVCLLPPVKKDPVLADVSKDYQVPCQNNSSSLLKPLKQLKKGTRLVWYNVFLGSILLPLHNSQKPSV